MSITLRAAAEVFLDNFHPYEVTTYQHLNTSMSPTSLILKDRMYSDRIEDLAAAHLMVRMFV